MFTFAGFPDRIPDLILLTVKLLKVLTHNQEPSYRHFQIWVNCNAFVFFTDSLPPPPPPPLKPQMDGYTDKWFIYAPQHLPLPLTCLEGYNKTLKRYSLYRAQRTQTRKLVLVVVVVLLVQAFSCLIHFTYSHADYPIPQGSITCLLSLT